MSFFGLTQLGDPNIFASSSRYRQPVQIHDVNPKEFLIEFKRILCENETPVLSRKLLPQLFPQVIQRQLHPKECELLLRFFNVQGGHITLEEFEEGLKRFQKATKEESPKIAWHISPTDKFDESVPKEKSYLKYEGDKIKHIRVKFAPSEVQRMPITANQNYGWEMETRPKPKNEYFPLMSTDVTRNEGINLDNYYCP